MVAGLVQRYNTTPQALLLILSKTHHQPDDYHRRSHKDPVARRGFRPLSRLLACRVSALRPL